MRPTVRRPGKMFIYLYAKRLYVQMNVQSVVPRGRIELPYHVPQTCVLPLNYNGMIGEPPGNRIPTLRIKSPMHYHYASGS